MKDGLRPIDDIYFRCISRKRRPLDATGALLNYGRYNIIGCAALYLASSPNLAVMEHLQLNEMFEIKQFPPRLLVSVRVKLTRVLDLTDRSVHERLGVTPEQLSLPYSTDSASPSVTQTIALKARKAGIEALLAPSAIEPIYANLVVFRDNVASPDALEVLGFDDHLDSAQEDER